MLYYPQQKTFAIIGSKSGTTRTASTLTAAYDGNSDSFEAGGYSKINLDVVYTMASGETGNSIQLKVEGSPDGTNYYRLTNESASGGTSTLTQREFTFDSTGATNADTFSIGLDIFYKYLKVSVKETGVGTNEGTAYVEGTLSGK